MKTLIYCFLLSSILYGSASLTVSGPTLSPDGVTLTVPIAGCTGPLSPSSGITGFTVDDNYHSGTVSLVSATASGCTVTLSIALPRASGEAIAIELAAGGSSNLIDASGNTPVGQISSGAVSVNLSATEWRHVFDGTFPSLSRSEGAHKDTTFGGSLAFISSDGCIRFNSDTAVIDVITYNGSNHWALLQDGVQIYDWGTNSPNTFTAQGLVPGLSGTHEYDICDYAAQAGSNTWITSVRLSSGSTTTQPAQRKLIAIAGDSLRAYWGPEFLTDSRLGDGYQVATSLGAAIQRYGSAGRQVCDSGPTPGLQTLIPSTFSVLDPSENLGAIEVAWSSGENDITAGTSASALAACWHTLLTSLEAVWPQIIVLGLYPNYNYDSTYEAAVKAEVLTHPKAVWVSTHDPAHWVNNRSNSGSCANSGDLQSDGIHIEGCATGTGIGYSKVAMREIPIFAGLLNGQSYSVSCPGAALVGTPITCTVMLPAGAKFSGSQTIGPAASGGTLSPSGAITPSAGATSFTFTFTASSIGSKTISFTNGNGGWIDPSPVSVTAFARGAGKSLLIPSGFRLAAIDPNRADSLPSRIEFQMHDWTLPTTPGGTYIADLNGVGISASITPGGVIDLHDKRDITTPGDCNLVIPPGATNLLIRAQRDPVALTFTCELWNYDSTGYTNASSTITTLGSGWPYSNGAIGDTTTGTTLALGFLRVFTTLVPIGSKVPTTADAGDWTELKFDGDLNDSTGNGHNAAGSGDTYVPTPGRVPIAVIKTKDAPFWSQTLPFRAGHPGQLGCGSSYSLADTSSSVTCFWQELSGPSQLSWSSHTGSQPTFSGLVFGDYLFQLQVTDAAGVAATTTQHIGAVATDDNGVVVQANPAADALFGPMIALGKNPWQYQDYIALHSAQVRSSYLANLSPPSWIKNLSGTISFTPYYGTTPNTTTLNGDITAAAKTIVLSNASKLDFSSLPGTPAIIQLGFRTAPAMEEVRICGISGNTLTVCYDGRGWRQGLFNEVATPLAWVSGTEVTQIKTAGTGTSFLADFCPAGPGEEGQITYSAGTVTVTAGSAALTGNGTTWDNTLTSLRIRISGTHANGSPFVFFSSVDTVNSGTSITMARNWPSDADSGTFRYALIHPIREIARNWLRADLTTGQQLSPISSCESDTQMYHMQSDSIANDNITPQAAQHYSYWDSSWVSEYGPNYYDEILAHYAGYYRSGLNLFRDNARAIGDYWTTIPEIDQGYIGITARHAGMTGIVAGAMLDGRTSNWYTIRRLANLAITNPFSGGAVASSCDTDVREDAYGLSWLALAAMFDPVDTGSSTTPNQRSYWKAQLDHAYTRDLGCKSADGAFAQPFYIGNKGAITLAHGSPNATGTGISPSLCNVTATGTVTLSYGNASATGMGFVPMPNGGQIVIKATHDGGTYALYYAGYIYNSPTSITLTGTNSIVSPWPWDSGTFSYQIEADRAYLDFATDVSDHIVPNGLTRFYTCTWVDSGHITLDRGWEGKSGTFNATRDNQTGYGVVPFQNGIKTLAMRYAALGANAPTASKYAALDQGTAKWILSNGFDPVTGGLYYDRVFYNCEPPTIYRLDCAYGPASKVPARTLSGEAQNAMTVAFQANPTPTNLAFGDQFYGAQWGKPGYGGPYSDGTYIDTLDGDFAFGHKWIGFLFGIGMSHQWPAARLGGIAPADTRTVNIPFVLSTVANAAKVRITITQPTGATPSPTVCTLSPCAVSVDGRAGSPLIKLDYLNPSDAVIAPGDTIPLYVPR